MLQFVCNDLKHILSHVSGSIRLHKEKLNCNPNVLGDYCTHEESQPLLRSMRVLHKSIGVPMLTSRSIYSSRHSGGRGGVAGRHASWK